ncbi:hypothetical protein C8R45DRAFT_929270 [Mycena sanguinolenta]|nr:hypothetical protein C8R45DRAFT_929270 [Mycena sanguinolenta]
MNEPDARLGQRAMSNTKRMVTSMMSTMTCHVPACTVSENDEKQERSRNPKAQACHHAKRKTYIEEVIITKNKKDALEVAKITVERTSALLDAFNGNSKDEIPQHLQKSIAHYAEKLEVVRKILAGLTTQNPVLASGIEELSLTLRLHTRWTDLVLQWNYHLAHESDPLKSQTKPAVPNLSIIRREELHFDRYWRLDGNTNIMLAGYNGRSVVVKKYGEDKAQWVRVSL